MQHNVTDRVAWFVCCHDCEACKNGWTYQHVVVNWGGTSEPEINWGQDPHIRRSKSEGEGWPLQNIETLCCELCKMAEPMEMPFGMLSGMPPRNHVLDGVNPHAIGHFWGGKRRSVVKYRDCPSWVVQKRLNQLRSLLECGLGWAQESIIRWGAHWTSWRIWLNRPCVVAMYSRMSYYFHHLLLLYVCGSRYTKT